MQQFKRLSKTWIKLYFVLFLSNSSKVQRLPMNLMDVLHVPCNTKPFAMESGSRQQSGPTPEDALTHLFCHQKYKGCHQATINTGERKHFKITHHSLTNIQKFSAIYKMELRQHNCCSPSVQGMVLPSSIRSFILHKFRSWYWLRSWVLAQVLLPESVL